jgi:hypothetical protein
LIRFHDAGPDEIIESLVMPSNYAAPALAVPISLRMMASTR